MTITGDGCNGGHPWWWANSRINTRQWSTEIKIATMAIVSWQIVNGDE